MNIEVTPHSGTAAYAAKPSEYFDGARRDYVTALLANPGAKILEIGCGEGQTGMLALSEGKCGYYYGVDVCLPAAEKAARGLSEVLVGNIEEMELPWEERSFDALILSEVLEHLVDPWAVLRKLHPLLKPGARVFASSPNVATHHIIRMLLRGEWNLADFGPMDRTHLRWFTPKTYAQMFESCGYQVDSVRELAELGPKGRRIILLNQDLMSMVLSQAWRRQKIGSEHVSSSIGCYCKRDSITHQLM